MVSAWHLRRHLTTLLLLIGAAGVAACASLSPAVPELDGDTLGDGFASLEQELSAEQMSLQRFAKPGPFSIRLRENQALKVGRETLIFDDAAPASASPVPLVILVHGNHSRKEAHRRQITHLATFGMHALALQLPNTDRWLENAQSVRRLVLYLQRAPHRLGDRVDTSRIILAGHSFGGSAITVAAAKGAPIKGLILLDPAVVDPSVAEDMAEVRVPVLLLAADRQIFRARKQRWFYQRLGGQVAETSVIGATHDDAQNPSMFSVAGIGFDPYTSPKRQSRFTAALTLGAFDLAAGGQLDFAWKALLAGQRQGLFTASRRRAAPAARDQSEASR